jgi:hypothetical protein
MNPLESVELRLKALIALREVIDREVKGLEDAKGILKPFYEVPEISSIPSIEEFVEAGKPGITDAVRAALRTNANRKLTATQVRDVMVSQGFDLGKDKYKNAMATIHEVLRRLIDAKQVTPSTQDNERSFQWIEKSPSLVVAKNPFEGVNLSELMNRVDFGSVVAGITAQAAVFESLKPSTAISEVLAQMSTEVSDVLKGCEQIEKKVPNIFFAPTPSDSQKKREIGPVSPTKPGEFGKKK